MSTWCEQAFCELLEAAGLLIAVALAPHNALLPASHMDVLLHSPLLGQYGTEKRMHMTLPEMAKLWKPTASAKVHEHQRSPFKVFQVWGLGTWYQLTSAKIISFRVQTHSSTVNFAAGKVQIRTTASHGRYVPQLHSAKRTKL